MLALKNSIYNNYFVVQGVVPKRWNWCCLTAIIFCTYWTTNGAYGGQDGLDCGAELGFLVSFVLVMQSCILLYSNAKDYVVNFMLSLLVGNWLSCLGLSTLQASISAMHDYTRDWFSFPINFSYRIQEMLCLMFWFFV